jgi:uncharacterized protein
VSGAPIVLAALPMELRPVGDAAWAASGEQLSVHAGARTDWFVAPGDDAATTMNAPALVGEIGGDYTLSARVAVEFRSTFDAGALVVYGGADRWGKLAFEYSPAREPMVVSVVTRGRSDDANAFTVDGGAIRLRIARLGSAYAFHASTDGTSWQLVRHFTLGDGPEPAVGFEAQSPLGDGCTAVFDEIDFTRERLAELRDGS